jgi:hypothetical protein
MDKQKTPLNEVGLDLIYFFHNLFLYHLEQNLLHHELPLL